MSAKVEGRIRELVQANLVPNRPFGCVQFMDQLFLVAAEVGTIKCWQVNNCKLCFQIDNQPAWEVELDRAHAKLRMLCARLAVFCMEKTGRDISIYGDETSLEICHSRQSQTETVCCMTRMHIQFRNNLSEPQWFMIETI